MLIRTNCLLTLFFIIVSCNRLSPAGFWKNYKSDFCVKSISDQGPYGGHRAIHWKSDKKNTFNSAEVLEFAQQHGWTFIDSAKFSSDQIEKWVFDDEPVVPITSTGFSDTLVLDWNVTKFPRWFGGDAVVLKFKTGWVTIKPGTDDTVEKNGFAMINRDGTEMAVYHLWGD